MVSLHATKLVTTGEGGVLVGDASWLADVKQWSNFGFRGQRVAGIRGTNAKLSEYGAAIGLASLDEWERTRSVLLSLTARYVSALRSVGLSAQPGLKDGTVSSTIVARFASKAARDSAEYSLNQHCIATRAWWSEGIHRMESFASCQKREDLVVTEALGDTTLGLPFYIDMTDRELDRIIKAIDESEVVEP
jgi:dTDP-4-amino-4,6-dideoxygalactose transaminase